MRKYFIVFVVAMQMLCCGNVEAGERNDVSEEIRNEVVVNKNQKEDDRYGEKFTKLNEKQQRFVDEMRNVLKDKSIPWRHDLPGK